MEPSSHCTANNTPPHVYQNAPPAAPPPGDSLGAASQLLRFLGVDMNITQLSTLVFMLTIAWQWICGWMSEVGAMVERNIWSSVTLTSMDPSFDQFSAWMSKQSFAKTSRSLDVRDGATNYEEDCYDSDDDGEPSNYGKRPFIYTPSQGLHYFKYKGRSVTLRRVMQDSTTRWGESVEYITLNVFGRDTTILKELLQEARGLYYAKDTSKTVVYRDGFRWGNTGWMRSYSRFTRPMETVVLSKKQKDDFVEDIRDYLDPRTAKWYNNRGIPYRRGYLFHGPPGTGKSSLSFAIAGLFGLKIYVISLSNKTLNESGLTQLFTSLPKQCIVLLEDIDSCGISREQDGNRDNKEESNSASGNESKPHAGISFSGLLNAIDGVASQEGRVLIATSNHPERLDQALIRPGRIDYQIEFKLADKEVLAELFERMFETHPEDSVDESEKAAMREASKREELKAMAQEFSGMLPGDEFSPAEIQGFLLRHKRSPKKALDESRQWVEDTREQKKKLKEKKEAAEEEARRKKEGAKKEDEEKKKDEEKKEEEKKEEEKKEDGKKEEEKKEESAAPSATTDQSTNTINGSCTIEEKKKLLNGSAVAPQIETPPLSPAPVET